MYVVYTEQYLHTTEDYDDDKFNTQTYVQI